LIQTDLDEQLNNFREETGHPDLSFLRM